jgi:hypothetical protein
LRAKTRLLILSAFALILLALAACAPAATPSAPAAGTKAPEATSQEKATLPAATQAAAASTQPSTAATATPQATEGAQPAQPVNEMRVVELEWPSRLRLGESDVLRLALVPSADGYTAQAEFPEHTLSTQTIPVRRPPGYTLHAVARLDGVAFTIAPSGDQALLVPPGEAVSWRWSLSPRAPGQQRLSVLLLLRWEADPGVSAQPRESVAFGRSLDVQVTSFFGLRQPEALGLGLFGLVFSSGLGLWALFARRAAPGAFQSPKPNARVSIEELPNSPLSNEDTRLMQALFGRYARLLIEREFLSGYSGARTFLARPVRPNGQPDAETIIKIGPRNDIRREFDNYETFVKDRLPPVTARIQRAPVALQASDRAAIQYTCISEPGKPPLSLRLALLENPDPTLILRLFDTFGPNWWMQRQPYAFRVAQEYDRLLPPHLMLAPAHGATTPTVPINPSAMASVLALRPGEIILLPAFDHTELRSDGQSLTLYGRAVPGQPTLRLRWLNLNPPNNTSARVLASRADLFAEYTSGFERYGLPDPLLHLDSLLQETIMGTRSVIHGDLNLENILVGPGSLVWLIDFAQTREGHPLFDFSHLASELIAHVLAERCESPLAYLNLLRQGHEPLLGAVEAVAQRCLFDPRNLREYHLALIMACLGALKYSNLSAKAKHCLYLTAAFYSS